MAVQTILLSQSADSRFRQAFQTYFDELGVQVSDWAGLFQEMDRDRANQIFLLLKEEEAIGFLQFQITKFSNWFFEEPFGFLREFWIAPACRGQGYGKMLLHLVEAHCAARGAHRILLTADDALTFYLGQGYRKTPDITAGNHMEVLSKTVG